MRTPFLLALLLLSVASADADDGACAKKTDDDNDYVVCRFPGDADIRLFLNDAEGEPYGHFSRLNEALEAKGERLAFAMNAGMYHEDRSPVGLYVENREQKHAINKNDGPGNFHLKPNGVFWVYDNREGGVAAYVQTTDYFLAGAHFIREATQSGPMLVIDGEIHPRFLRDSDSLKRRNGVGVTAQGDVVFVLADSPVRFYDFARFFRHALKTPNALYLDGTISRIYAPDLGRNDPGLAMGPIIGVVVSDD